MRAARPNGGVNLRTMTTENHTTAPGERPWLRPVVLAASCVVIGFVGGWVLHGGGDSTATLPKVSDDFARSLTAQSPPSRTVTVEDGATQTGGAVAAPDRGTVTVHVLNGTTTSGLAARTADRLRGIQYRDVSTGNVTTGSGQSVVYFRPGQRPAAAQLASDLQISAPPQALPPGSPAARAARDAPAADVVVVLRAE